MDIVAIGQLTRAGLSRETDAQGGYLMRTPPGGAGRGDSSIITTVLIVAVLAMLFAAAIVTDSTDRPGQSIHPLPVGAPTAVAPWPEQDRQHFLATTGMPFVAGDVAP
jgi:hypothetical protein